jgi:hypothetical protein
MTAWCVICVGYFRETFLITMAWAIYKTSLESSESADVDELLLSSSNICHFDFFINFDHSSYLEINDQS